MSLVVIRAAGPEPNNKTRSAVSTATGGATGSIKGFGLSATSTSTGEAVLTDEPDYDYGPPDLEVQILDPKVPRAPSSITVVIAGAAPEERLDFSVNGYHLAFAFTDSDGYLLPTSIGIPDYLGEDRVLAGTYTLDVTAPDSDTVGGSADFSFGKDAYLRLNYIVGADVDPVEVPGVFSHDTQHWVLQDPLPGGLGSYVMPINPSEADSPPFTRVLTSKATTAPLVGRFHMFEAAFQPTEWSFSGQCPDREMYERLLEFSELNRRFYLIDHRNRAWIVAPQQFDVKPRRVTNWNGVNTNWFQDYTFTVVVHEPK